MAKQSKRHYYAGHSYMGINYTYDCDCWKAYRFDSKKERDEWVEKHEYSQSTGNYVAEAVSRKVAMRIIGLNSKYKTVIYDHANHSIAACWA